MAPQDRYKLLSGLKRNKKNRSVGEAQELLEAFGFEYRAASKEQGGVWKRGVFTITLPMPHGGRDKVLSPRYIALVVRVIEVSEANEKDEISH